MTPFVVIVTLIVIGLVLWLINAIPMPIFLKSSLNTIVILLIIFWLLLLFGIVSIEGYDYIKLK